MNDAYTVAFNDVNDIRAALCALNVVMECIESCHSEIRSTGMIQCYSLFITVVAVTVAAEHKTGGFFNIAEAGNTARRKRVENDMAFAFRDLE